MGQATDPEEAKRVVEVDSLAAGQMGVQMFQDPNLYTHPLHDDESIMKAGGTIYNERVNGMLAISRLGADMG